MQYVNNACPLTLKYPCANISPNLFLQKCKQQHLDTLKEVENAMGTCWRIKWRPLNDYKFIAPTHKKKHFVIFAWLLTFKNPCANMDPTLFFQKCKQQYWDILNEVKTPWILVGASNSGHSMIAYLLRQLTKSNILRFVLDLWPLKIFAPTWTQIYFFKNASSSTEIN